MHFEFPQIYHNWFLTYFFFTFESLKRQNSSHLFHSPIFAICMPTNLLRHKIFSSSPMIGFFQRQSSTGIFRCSLSFQHLTDISVFWLDVTHEKRLRMVSKSKNGYWEAKKVLLTVLIGDKSARSVLNFSVWAPLIIQLAACTPWLAKLKILGSV